MRKIIYWVIIILMLVLLFGCAKQPVPSESITNGAISTANAIEQSLSEGCKTEGIKMQLFALKSQINSINEACKVEKGVIEEEKVRWKLGFWGLLVAIGLYIIRKILK